MMENYKGTKCQVCGGYMLEVDGCLSNPVNHMGKQYEQVKVGGEGDLRREVWVLSSFRL
jgi:hypothetical protein